MTEQTQAGEQPVEKTNVEGTTEQPKEETVTLSKDEVETLIKTAEEATALAEKKSSDAENYRKGMLKYKSKLKDEYGDEDEEEKPQLSEERIAQIVEERLKAIAPKPTQDDDLIKANQKIEELKTVISNRQQLTPSAAGSNQDKTEIKSSPADKFFSPEQIAEIKAKYPNVNPDDILRNLPTNGVQPGFSGGNQNA